MGVANVADVDVPLKVTTNRSALNALHDTDPVVERIGSVSVILFVCQVADVALRVFLVSFQLALVLVKAV
jgi:hypothetical protein